MYARRVKLQISPHARVRIQERGIAIAEVESTIAAPRATIALIDGRTEYQAIVQRNGKPVLLRVITVVDVLVTAMLTSRIAKYEVLPR